MKRKLFLKIILGVVTLVLLIKLLTIFIFEPWAGKKIQAALNEKNRDYLIGIDNVHILMIKSGIELDSITISSKQEHRGDRDLNGKIASIKFKGINLAKAIFKKEVNISKVTIINCNIKGKIPFSGKVKSPIVSPLNIRIDRLFFDKIDLAMENTLNAQSYSLKKGILRVYNLQVEKQDTLTPEIVQQFDFEAEELVSVSSDSMYSFTASNIIYSATSNTLAVDWFSIQPNYTNYDFTSRYNFQKDRIEARFSNICIQNFNAAGYLASGNLISSSIGIRKMDMEVFRDARKEFRHLNKPAFQDMIKNYPGTIRIDTISLTNGNVTYTEHAPKATEPGSISFSDINAKIYRITNDVTYKTKNNYLVFKGAALLMGKGRMTILLKGRMSDNHNTFSLDGTLSGMEANELNPMLEKNAFIYVTSGKIDAMNFRFTANNTGATGNMTMLYHGLDIAVKNKLTDDTTAFRERFISFIVNNKVLDSNPIQGEEVREGKIDYERDNERSLVNYCCKSILSGIKSSITRNQTKKKNLKKN